MMPRVSMYVPRVLMLEYCVPSTFSRLAPSVLRRYTSTSTDEDDSFLRPKLM